ncbi:MAG: hypothetical protein JRF33_15670 [Deltaproteobacteria bacterium]|nr:hypothetical protein [Deltaproteobacteria bacterium]
MRFVFLLIVAFPQAGPVWAAGSWSLSSAQTRRQVSVEGKTEAMFLLPPGDMMVLKVDGPTHLGLRLRQVLTPPRQPMPVDLTVVRDDSSQATVRFKSPAVDGASLIGGSTEALSGPLLVKIEVPAGKHLYRLLISGPVGGVLLAPFTGRLADSQVAVLATPGGPGEVKTPTGAKKRRRRTRKPPMLPEPEIIAGVDLHKKEPDRVRIDLIFHKPEPDGERCLLGPGARIAAGIGGMVWVGAGLAAIGGAVQEGRAADDDVQIGAYESLGHADRAYETAAVLAGIGGAALITAVIFYLIEDP